ncbi:YcxB family protein [Alkalihalobacterium bogoriense]|uniref:YcxB family protein n=1 Tax=Alkalihalobacterium bogoriense TaxID=246272 RepID=UPI00047B2BB2|nr:YcxB family protein [Alkalihalobacterium bogoriense]
MEVTYTTKSKDYRDLLIEGRPNSNRKLLRILFHYIILPLLFFYIYYHFYWNSSDPLFILLSHALFFVFLWCFLFIPLVVDIWRLFSIQNLQSTLKVEKNTLLDEKKLAVKKDGVSFMSPASTIHVQWEQFLNVVENNTHFFFIFKESTSSETGGRVLPKDDLKQDIIDELHHILSTRVPSFCQKNNAPTLRSIPFVNRAALCILCLILFIVTYVLQ